MTQTFRLATPEDFSDVTDLFNKAIIHMNAQGIHQWDELYPTSLDLQTDIERGEMYLLIIEGSIASVVVLNEFQQTEYLDGQWQETAGRPAVVHRLCVHPAFWGQGLATKTMELSHQLLMKTGYSSVRLDAFSLNPSALKLYARLGYRNAGTIMLRKGLFYLFEKQLLQ